MGSMGCYVSINKKTNKIEHACLLNIAAMNKDLFHLSGVTDALVRFSNEVSLSVDDVSALGVAMGQHNSSEPFVFGLSSGRMKEKWNDRCNYPAGPCGMSVNITVQHKGTIHSGKGNIRRTQPFNTKNLEGKRLNMITKVVNQAIFQSNMKKKNLPWTEEELTKEYKDVTKTVSAAADPKKKGGEVTLGSQHLIKVMAQGGVLFPPGLITQGTISLTNTNANKCRETAVTGEITDAPESAVDAYVSKDRGKMETHQKALVDYCGQFFSDYNKSMNENDNCEELRRITKGKRKPFPSTDVVFAGQHFFDTEKTASGNYEVVVYKPEWNGEKFIARRVHDFGKINYLLRMPLDNFPDGTVQTRIKDKDGVMGDQYTEEASHDGLVITRDNVGPVEFLEIKKLFCCPQAPGESYEDYNQKICETMMQFPNVRRFVGSEGREPAEGELFGKEEWEIRAEAWNSSIEEPLERLIKVFSKNASDVGNQWDDGEGNNDDELDATQDTPPPAKKSRPNNSMNAAFNSISQTVTGIRDRNSFLSTLPTMAATLPATSTLPKRPQVPTAATLPNTHPAVGRMTPPVATLPNTTPLPSVFGKSRARRTGRALYDPKVNEFPILKSKGQSRNLDWTKQNMEDCRDGEWKANCRIMILRPNQSPDRVYADNFRQYEGSHDLLETRGRCAHVKITGFHDLAKDAVNSSLKAAEKTVFHPSFSNTAFRITFHKDDNGVIAGCSAENTNLDDTKFSVVGRCQLVDEIASRLQGTKTLHENEIWWIFKDEPIAIEFQNYCCLFCCGHSSFYQNLHTRARKKHNQWIRTKNEILLNAEGGRKRRFSPEINQEEEGGNFIVAFGNQKYLPFFYVIGTQGKKNARLIQHDFSIAIPDRTYYYHYANGTRKPVGKYGKGNALYIRFLGKEASGVAGSAGSAWTFAEV
jgi:hypothetical protein